MENNPNIKQQKEVTKLVFWGLIQKIEQKY